jgi:hypothetical protein
MRYPLSHHKAAARRPALRLETLDDRVAPAATSLYVITQEPTPGFFGSASTLKEFTPFGNLVRTVPVVPAAQLFEQAHDLVLTDNRVHVYNGTTEAYLYQYNSATGVWGGVGQGGTNTDVAAVGSGGVARFGYDVFMTDMPIPGQDTTQGIVWMNVETASVPVMRFAEDHAPIDVAAGLDGKLYSLDQAGVVRVYNPDPNPPEPPLFPQIGSVTLPAQVTVPNVGTVTMDYRAIAVNEAGKIYAADWNGYLVRFSATGAVEASHRLPVTIGPNTPVVVENLVDLDFVPAPEPYDVSVLMVGSTNGVIARVDAGGLFARQLFDAGDGPAYLTLEPALVEVGITGPTANVTEGDVGVTPVEFTVRLSNPSAQPVTVNWTTAAGNATSGIDYETGSGILEFQPGETTKTVTVNVIGDRDDELNESFHVRISAPAGTQPGAVYANTQASAVIADDDPAAAATPAFAVSAGDARDDEPDGVFDFFTGTTGKLQPYNTTQEEKRSILEFDTNGINLAAAPVVTLDVYTEFPWWESTTARVYGYAGNGTAALADAYETGTLLGTLNNIAGANIATAWRRITLDRTALEGLMAQGPYVGIVIAADANTFFDVHGTGSAHAPRLNFWDSAPPALPTITVQGFTSTEGNSPASGGAVLFNIRLSQPTTVPVSVDYQTRDQPEVLAGVDYVAAAGTVTFQPGEVSKDVYVQLIGDTTFEPDENFLLDLSNPTIASFRTLSAFGRISNDDLRPTVTASTFSAPEGNSGSATTDVVLTLSNPSYQTIDVQYTTANGTATAGSDYAATTATVTFLPGQTTKAIPITIFGDTTYEPNEDFQFQITGVTNASVAGTGTVVQTILNDDAVPTLSVGNWSGPEGTGGLAPQYTFRVSLSNRSYQPVTFNYAMADGTATGGIDYGLFPPGTVTIPAGSIGYDFIGTISPDNMYEPDETFTFAVSNPTNATLGAQSVGTGTIINDDPRPTVGVNSRIVTEGNGGTTTMTFTVSLSRPSYQTVTVDFATVDGTAAAGSDYAATAGTVTFAPGQTSRTVDVLVSGDTLHEANEQFSLLLSNPTNAVFGTTAGGTGTITNDDAAPTAAVDSPAVAEGDSGTTDLTFTVSLSNPSGTALTVNYSTANVTAIAGADYTAASGALTFAPGQTSRSVVVSVVGDRTREPDETLKLNASLAGLSTSGTGTIVNDDPVPTVSAGAAVVDEGSTGQTTDAVFTVSLTNPSAAAVTVDYQVADGTALAADGDYTPVTGTLTFAPGETSKTVAVPVRGDAKHEPDETFTLALSNASGATQGADGTGTIRNDDAVPVLHITDRTVAEGNAGSTPMTFTVTLSNPSSQAVTVDVATANGTAAAPGDYAAVATTLTFAPGETSKDVTVAVVGDQVYEGDEQFTANLSNPTNATVGTAQATGAITDDDGAPVANAGLDRTGDEGAGITFDGSGSFDPDGDPLTYTWDFGDGGTGTGAFPTHAYADDGVYTVTLTVDDGNGGTSTDTAVVTVRNVAPVAGVTVPTTGVRGQSRTFTLTATDPSAVDQAAPFGYRIDWGDGTPVGAATGSGAGTTASHTYTAAGTYTVRVRATDKDGSEGAAASRAYTTKIVEIQGTDLVVGGTTAADTIVLGATTTVNAVKVTINGAVQGTFTPAGQVIVHAQDGGDAVTFASVKQQGTSYNVRQPLLLFGDAGNDTLDARNATGAAVLVGGAGNDKLFGSRGRTILVGGAGADDVRGGDAEDIVIGGSTSHDADPTGLAAVRAEWARTDASYATRRDRLLGVQGGGLNGTYVLTATGPAPTVLNDGGAIDTMFGYGGQDWYFAAATDRLSDRQSNETVTGL